MDLLQIKHEIRAMNHTGTMGYRDNGGVMRNVVQERKNTVLCGFIRA